jgi:hypothetical protein
MRLFTKEHNFCVLIPRSDRLDSGHPGRAPSYDDMFAHVLLIRSSPFNIVDPICSNESTPRGQRATHSPQVMQR